MSRLSVKWPLCQQVPQKTKKLVAISAISVSITEKMRELELGLEQVPSIWYPVIFKD